MCAAAISDGLMTCNDDSLGTGMSGKADGANERAIDGLIADAIGGIMTEVALSDDSEVVDDGDT